MYCSLSCVSLGFNESGACLLYNTRCDPEEEEDCEATMANDKDLFIMIFEAVSGDNAYYGPLEGGTYPYDPID
jgi:hypothetical protein